MIVTEQGAMRRRRVRDGYRRRPANRRLPLQILRTSLARLMIDRYGDDASTQAAMQGNMSLAKGDLSGLVAWLKVIIVTFKAKQPYARFLSEHNH
jgi:hypothetical protein